MPETLEMEAVDVSGSAFEDVLGELLTENPDAVAPVFNMDMENPEVVECVSCGCTSCSCTHYGTRFIPPV